MNDRRAGAIVAATALVAGSPALSLPLLSDDWVNLDAVTYGVPWRTVFGYVRPVYLALFHLERSAWGLTAWPYHAVSLALFAACAWLVFATVRRLGGDLRLATAAGIVFSVNPFAIEAAAWVAARADLLAVALGLASVLAWHAWRRSGRPAALAATVAAFGAALLSKESAIVVPGLLAVTEMAAPRPRPRSAGAAIAALAALGAAHLLIFRPQLLGVAGDALPRVTARGAAGTAIAFATATVLPLPAEILEFHHRSAAAVAALTLVALLAAAWRGSGRIPGPALAGASAAAIAGLPALLAFQERYALFASAGAAVALVALVRACGRGARFSLLAAAAVVWPVCTVLQWVEWLDAGRASEAVMATLARQASDPAVREIVVANAPHRVRGAPVVTDFSAAAAVLTGRRVPVFLASRVDYGRPAEDDLDDTGGPAVCGEGRDVVVRLSVPSGVYRRLVRPAVREGETADAPGGAHVSRGSGGALTVRIPGRLEAGRSILVWRAGALVPAASIMMP